MLSGFDLRVCITIVLIACMFSACLGLPFLITYATRRGGKCAPTSYGDAAPPQPLPKGEEGEPVASKDVHCPDGSGTCASDDDPDVPKVAVSAACSSTTPEVYKAWNRKQKWGYSMPIIGAFWKSLDTISGNGDPTDVLVKEMQTSALRLRDANAHWQNTYMKSLGTLAKDVLPVTQAVFTTHDGFIDLTTDMVAMPITHAVRMLLAPVLGLLASATVLVWSI